MLQIHIRKYLGSYGFTRANGIDIVVYSLVYRGVNLEISWFLYTFGMLVHGFLRLRNGNLEKYKFIYNTSYSKVKYSVC